MVRNLARLIGTLIFLVALCSVHDAWAGSSTDQLRDGVERVLKILRDPELKGEENANKRTILILRIAHEIFDFGEMAKRSLGQHWNQRTPVERGEFVRLFTELIKRAYISKVDLNTSERMVVRGETVDGDHAVVRTTLFLDRGREIPLDYRMHKTDDRWQVYDVTIGGTGLVANYRAQFNKIISTASYEVLVTKLTSKQSAVSAPVVPAGGTLRSDR